MSDMREAATDELDDDDLQRYARQIVLREVGPAGQRRLRAASVAVVGAGGLGSATLLYLAAAGVGRLTVVDDDRVSLDNLQRQVLHDTPAIGEPKVHSALRRIDALNPRVRVRTVERRLDAGGAAALLAGHDVVVDGSDNFATKFAVNDACVGAGVCAVIGGILRFDGQVVVVPPGAPCYRCLFHDEPPPGQVPTCSAAGVLGPVAGVVGSLQASEALRFLLGIGAPQAGRVLTIDLLDPRVRSVPFPADPACPACARRPAAVVAR
ncbi:MAG TPA: HesA/MoeB/ThiF family protein [Candidatus Dormibacteraeota bacterium]|jgi:adenylyltransferase/sulfurtransferase|nr:HesA/MoeB/ThiF family protein [Candidatus Dormibacteraeota bacterium]